MSEPARDASLSGVAIATLQLADTGEFPNSPHPVLIYGGVFVGVVSPEGFEQLFARHGWTGSWRNGLYREHHFHSTAHEVLGVYRGWVEVRLGGPQGNVVRLSSGDVAVIPAGVAHKNERQSADFAVVGAYPAGTGPDMQYGKPGERPRVDRNIAALAVPPMDPVQGAGGALPRSWLR